MRYLTVLFLTAALAGIASADLTMSLGTVDPTGVLGEGWITNTVSIDTTSDWLSAVLVVEPEGGGIYQDAMGSEQSPNPAWIGMVPSLEFDTYISNGVLGETCSTAAAVDLGYSSIIFDDTMLAISWYTTDTDDLGTLELVRATLETSCSGSWSFKATASPAGGPYVEVMNGDIVNGVLMPEPATLGLLAIGGLGVLIRRKR